MALPQPAEMTAIAADDNGNFSGETLSANGTAQGMDILSFYRVSFVSLRTIKYIIKYMHVSVYAVV